MKKILFAGMAGLIIAVCFISACVTAHAIEVGGGAPDFTLPDLEGNKVNLSDYKGKVIILDFFASWCPPCRQEIPDFIKLQDAYSSKGFTVIGVALVNLEDAKNFASQIGINYPVLIDDEKASAAFGPIRSIPTTFVIGKDMKIAKMYIGFRPKETFEKDIQDLLK